MDLLFPPLSPLRWRLGGQIVKGFKGKFWHKKILLVANLLSNYEWNIIEWLIGESPKFECKFDEADYSQAGREDTTALKRLLVLRRVLLTFGLRRWLITENPYNLPWVWRISRNILSTLQDYRTFSLLPPSLNDFPFHQDKETKPGETVSE